MASAATAQDQRDATTPSSPRSPLKREPLPSLKTLDIKPSLAHHVPSISSQLLRIERVHISKALSSTHSYTIGLCFHQSQSRIPTRSTLISSNRRTQAALHCTPDLEIEYPLKEIVKFRDAVHTCVGTAHPAAPCKFCDHLIDFLALGSARPMVFTRLAYDAEGDGSEEIALLLQRLLEDCQALLVATARVDCRGQRNIPLMLYKMLYGATSGEAA